MDELEILAAKLNKLSVDPQARMGYDLFAGGLVWSDEKPVWDEATGNDGIATIPELSLFRALLNHRSMLILGERAERFQNYWEKAMRLCPSWPGFLPARREPTLAYECRSRSEASIRAFEEPDARYQQKQKAQASTTDA